MQRTGHILITECIKIIALKHLIQCKVSTPICLQYQLVEFVSKTFCTQIPDMNVLFTILDC